MRRGDDEQRIEPRAALFDDVAILDDNERGAAANTAARLRAQPRERVARMLFPVAVRLEDHRNTRAVGGELRDDVFDDPRSELSRERAVIVAAQPGLRGVATEQDRRAQLDPTASLATSRRRGAG